MSILKYRLRVYLVLIIFTSVLISCEEEKEISGEKQFNTPSVKAMSFNVRFNNPADGVNSWENRKAFVISYLKNESPDIIGMQEVLNDQLIFLDNLLNSYDYVGVGREDGETEGEYTPIFYNIDRFELIDQGTFWLSETPSEPSLGWDAVIKRICTYAILLDNQTEAEVHIYNTHFDHVGAIARARSAELIVERIRERSNNHRVILMGDLNAEPTSVSYETIVESGISDSFFSEIRFGPEGTWNGFSPNSLFNRRIDYVFYSGFSSKIYTTENILINGNFLSDHFPVVANLEYRPLSK